jgi:hypothetical protein
MKKKQNRKVKRLELNRETVVRLSNDEIKKAKGQGIDDCTGCPSGCGIYVALAAE